MKYFNPSYWFKLWILSAPLFNSENQGIYAKSIYNQKIKDWVSKDNSSLELINESNSFTNISNYQPYSLNETNQNIDPFYQSFLDSFSNQQLETSNHKHYYEKSRRIKKQVRPICQLETQLIIDEQNLENYQLSFQNLIDRLEERAILVRILDSEIFTLNPNCLFGYFEIPIEIRLDENGEICLRNIRLVLRTDNLYLEGFIVNNTYYYFDFTLIDQNMQPQAVRDRTIPHLTYIQGMRRVELTGISPDYRHLLSPSLSNSINRNIVLQSFVTLTDDIIINHEQSRRSLAQSLGNVIVVIIESLRFRNLRNIINNRLIINNDNILISYNTQNYFYRLLISWGRESQTTESFILHRIFTSGNEIIGNV